MVISPELAIAGLGVIVTQGVAVTAYVVKAARYAGSADEHLKRIDEHLTTLNSRVTKNSDRIGRLESDPKWLDRANQLSHELEFVGRQTQALLQDTNERRVLSGLPALQVLRNGV